MGGFIVGGLFLCVLMNKKLKWHWPADEWAVANMVGIFIQPGDKVKTKCGRWVVLERIQNQKPPWWEIGACPESYCKRCMARVLREWPR